MRKIGFALLLVLAVCLTPASYIRVAVGHADYDRAEPAADSVVDVAPTQVRIWFTQEVFRRQGANSIEVARADGTRIDLNDTAIDDDDRKLMTVSLAPDLAAGVYTVRWRALSAEDGHEGEGEFRFTIETDSTQPLATTDAIADTVEVSDTVDTTTVTETATAGMTVTIETAVAPTSTLSPPPTAVSTTVPTSTVPVATAASPDAPAPESNLTCFGVAMPLALALGAVVVQRRRRL